MNWTPSLRSDLDLSALPLDARQGYLASRLDGRTDLEALGALTGLEPEAVAALLDELVAMGAGSGRTVRPRRGRERREAGGARRPAAGRSAARSW